MTIENVLVKVKKLFALSGSSNEHEAALALARAQELLDKYNLSIEQLDDVESEEEKKVVEDTFMEKGSYSTWEKHLMINIVPALDCSFFIRKFRHRDKNSSSIVVGVKADVEFVKFVIPYLKDILEKLAWEYRCKKRTEYGEMWDKTLSRQLKQSFCIGAINEITKIIKQQRTKTSEVTALIVRKKDLVDEHMSQYKLKSSGYNPNVYHPDAYESGAEAGKKINLNRPVGAGESSASQGALE